MRAGVRTGSRCGVTVSRLRVSDCGSTREGCSRAGSGCRFRIVVVGSLLGLVFHVLVDEDEPSYDDRERFVLLPVELLLSYPLLTGLSVFVEPPVVEPPVEPWLYQVRLRVVDSVPDIVPPVDDPVVVLERDVVSLPVVPEPVVALERDVVSFPVVPEPVVPLASHVLERVVDDSVPEVPASVVLDLVDDVRL